MFGLYETSYQISVVFFLKRNESLLGGTVLWMHHIKLLLLHLVHHIRYLSPLKACSINLLPLAIKARHLGGSTFSNFMKFNVLKHD